MSVIDVSFVIAGDLSAFVATARDSLRTRVAVTLGATSASDVTLALTSSSVHVDARATMPSAADATSAASAWNALSLANLSSDLEVAVESASVAVVQLVAFSAPPPSSLVQPLAPPPQTPILCFPALPTSADVTVAGGIYKLQGQSEPFGITAGQYVLRGVPEAHPIRVFGDALCNVSMQGGTGVGDSWYGDVTVTIGPACSVGARISLECVYHGAMGGTGRLRVQDTSCSSASPPPPPVPQPPLPHQPPLSPPPAAPRGGEDPDVVAAVTLGILGAVVLFAILVAATEWTLAQQAAA